MGKNDQSRRARFLMPVGEAISGSFGPLAESLKRGNASKGKHVFICFPEKLRLRIDVSILFNGFHPQVFWAVFGTGGRQLLLLRQRTQHDSTIGLISLQNTRSGCLLVRTRMENHLAHPFFILLRTIISQMG